MWVTPLPYPVTLPKKVVDDILEYGNVQKGILGISAARANTPYAIEKGINQIEGVYISGIEEDTGAEEADLREGDIIKKIDDIKIRKFADLTGYLSSKRPTDTVQVTIDRNKEQITVPVVLKRRQVITVPNMGLEIKNLSEDDKKKFRTKKGVKVVGVPEIYRGYGLDGKVLLSLDDEEINDIEEARILFGRISRRGRTIITMINEKGERERLIFQ